MHNSVQNRLINHETLLLDTEMDVILAVAIGGTSLGGGDSACLAQ